MMNLQDFVNPLAPKPLLEPVSPERQEIVDAIHDFVSGAASNQPGLGAPGVNEDESLLEPVSPERQEIVDAIHDFVSEAASNQPGLGAPGVNEAESLLEAMGEPDSGLQPDPEPMENAAKPGQPSLDGIVVGGAADSGSARSARPHGRDTANADLQHRLTAEPDPTMLRAAEFEFIPGPQSPAIEPIEYSSEQAEIQEEYFKMAREHRLFIPDPGEALKQASQLGLHDSPVEPSTRRHRDGYDPLQQAWPRPSVTVRYRKIPALYRDKRGYMR